MVIKVTKIVLALSLLMATAGFAEEIPYDYNRGLGLLEICSQSPAQSLRLTLPTVIPADIKPGWRTDIRSTWTNVWAKESEFLLDYEMLDTVVALSYGFNTRFGLLVAFQNRNYFGGEMDSFIQGVHDQFGIRQNGRDEVPKDRGVVELFDPQTGENVLEFSAGGLNSNRLCFLLNYNISHGTQTWPSLNLYAVAGYPLKSADIFEDDNQVDVGFGLGAAKRWSKKWYTYGAVGFTRFDERGVPALAPGMKPLELEDEQLTGMFSLSWHCTPTFAILAQYLCSGPAVKDVRKLDEPSHEVHLGFKWSTQRHGVVQFGLIENVIVHDNSPDFGLHLGWSYQQ